MAQFMELPWGKEKISIGVPDHWHIQGVLEPASIPPVSDTKKEVLRALKEPIGCARLEDIAAERRNVVVVIDDISRPTPVWEIFPEVLEELHQAGVTNSQITILPALGVHRGMEEPEILKRLGLPDLAGLQWKNHDADNYTEMQFLGITSRGTPVWFNKFVTAADLVISIGCIEPHIIASFGGGYKNLLPGVAGKLSIAHNHALNCEPSTFNMVGQPIEDNAMRMDLEEAGRMLKAPVFVINAIQNNHQQVVQIVTGDPILAHRAGVRVSANLYGVKVDHPADIVITDSHPMDSDLRQGVKALANTIRAMKPGGMMITLVKAEEGVGVFGLANRKLPLGRSALRLAAPLILPLVKKLKLKGMGEEDRFFLYFALQAMRMGTLLLYAPSIPTEIHERLPFVTFTPSLDAALERAEKRYRGRASVLVFPNGGITYPNFN